jgi:general secretion pathway protein F
MNFRINALNASQAVVTLELAAANEAMALDAARRQGLTVLSIRSRGWTASLRPASAPSRRGRFPLTLFSVELMSLLEAGLNLVEALQALTEKEAAGSGGGERQRVLAGILAAIRRGESFSQAVAGFPEHFPALFIATLKASEQTGNLPEALSRYIAYQEELDRVRKKVVSAMIYPAILMVVGSLVLSFLMFYVVPRFARVYEDVSDNLPFFSRLLLAAGRGMEQNGGLIAACAALLLVTAVYAVSRPGFRAWFNRRLWRVPGLGERMKVYQLARLYRSIGMLLRAGVPAVRAFDMVRDLLSAHLRLGLVRARELIAEGRPMSAALDATGLATPVALRMMMVGERSGEMGDIMGRIARFHDDEIARFLDWFTRAFEPVLMAVLGIAVGGVVVLMYMPIFELAGNIQ